MEQLDKLEYIQEKYQPICERAYYDIFKKHTNQVEVLREISKDIGIFELMSLPSDVMRALIGIGTLKLINNNSTFREVYKEMLLKALGYIKKNKEKQEEKNNNMCKVIYFPKKPIYLNTRIK